MTFDAWKTYWKWDREKSAVLGGVPWRKLPGSDRLLHAQTAADYALVDAAIDDSAVGVTGEVGVQADRLPQLPPDPVPPPPDARQP